MIEVITVTCDRAHRLVSVVRFAKVPEWRVEEKVWPAGWRVANSRDVRPRPTMQVLDPRPEVTALLDAQDRDVARLPESEVAAVDVVRERFDVRCGLCGMSTTVRAERLNPIFDTLAAHGIDTISLTGLAARLS